MRPRVSVIGHGEVALTAASRLGEAGVFEVVRYDSEADRRNGTTGSVAGDSAGLRETSGSRVLVLIPDSRAEVVEAEKAILRDLADILPFSSDPLIVLADATSAALCETAHVVGAAARHRLIGTGTLPDSLRLQELIARELGISVQGVEAIAVGQPGIAAVPLIRFATASGVPVLDVLDAEKIGAVLDQFRQTPGDDGLFPSTDWVSFQASAIERIVTAVGLGRVDLVPCTVMLRGEYGLRDVSLSVPAVLGAEGVQRIVELDLSMDELVPLRFLASELKGVAVSGPR